MPHGDFSDFAGVALIVGGFLQIFKPDFASEGLGPLRPNFDDGNTAEMTILGKICGGFMIILGCMLFSVRWNTLNGKLSGVACLGCAVNIAHTTFNDIDRGVFKPRLFYAYAVIMALTALHLIFNANPLIKPAEDQKKK